MQPIARLLTHRRRRPARLARTVVARLVSLHHGPDRPVPYRLTNLGRDAIGAAPNRTATAATAADRHLGGAA